MSFSSACSEVRFETRSLVVSLCFSFGPPAASDVAPDFVAQLGVPGVECVASRTAA